MRQLSTERQSHSGMLMIALAATLWGTTGTSQALAPAGATPLTVGAMRVIVGAVVLVGVALVGGGFRQRSRWHIPTTLLAAAMTALYQLAFFGGTRLTGVAVGTVVGIGSAPIFAGLLGAIFERERISGRWLAATVVATVGAVLLVSAGDAAMVVNPLGIALSLGAGLSYAVFTLANKRLVAVHRSDEAMAVTFGLGALMMLPLVLMSETAWMATPRGLAVVLHLGIIATGLSYVFFGRGLRTVNVSTTGTLTLMEPLTAAALGLFFLREPVTVPGVAGMVMIFAGLMLLTLPARYLPRRLLWAGA